MHALHAATLSELGALHRFHDTVCVFVSRIPSTIVVDFCVISTYSPSLAYPCLLRLPVHFLFFFNTVFSLSLAHVLFALSHAHSHTHTLASRSLRTRKRCAPGCFRAPTTPPPIRVRLRGRRSCRTRVPFPLLGLLSSYRLFFVCVFAFCFLLFAFSGILRSSVCQHIKFCECANILNVVICFLCL